MAAENIAMQMIKFQKNFFEQNFNTICTVQDQTEEMADSFVKQIAWIPEETIKAVRKSFEIYKDMRVNYKKAVDDGFLKLEEFFEKK